MGVLLNEIEDMVETHKDCECQSRTPASIHSAYQQAEFWKLIRVVKGQQEESNLPPNGWWDIWCFFCDLTAEPFQGTLEQAAREFDKAGWSVLDAANLKAICLECVNKDDEAHYASQYEDNRGLLG